MSDLERRFRVAVDIGGTFTDCVVVDEAGARTLAKALTTHDALDDGVLAALEVAARELGLDRPGLLAHTVMLLHGTTVATNAVLTRTGARTGLIATRGHEDALVIGKVFAKRAGLAERDVVHSSRLDKPRPFVPHELIRGVAERVDVDGDVLVALQENEARVAIDELVAAGVEAIAVAFLWSFVSDVHERRLGELLAERAPGVFVSLSCEVAPVLGEYERTATAVLNAYVGPKVAGYLAGLERRLQEEGLSGPLYVLQAGGGLTSVEDASARPIVTLDSGPAGGILGARYLGRLYGEDNIVCTDVGGTSFEVGLIVAGEAPVDPDPVIAQHSLRIPKLAVKSIGAGGGSIAWIDAGGLLRVGPQSAGSLPGPACYGLGGEQPTVTDADLVLGYLDPGSFLGGRMRLDRDLALRALAGLGDRLGLQPEEVAAGIFRIVNAQMADLIRRSTIEQGHDPRDCVLVAYGGAGPTHAAFYGRDIGARALLVPARSTAFSAEGMLTCDVVHTAQGARFLEPPLSDADFAMLTHDLERLEQKVLAQFEREGTAHDEVRLVREVGVRYRKQAHTLAVAVDDGPLAAGPFGAVQERFEQRYASVYGAGALLHDADLELEQQVVTGSRHVVPPPLQAHPLSPGDGSHAVRGSRQVMFPPGGYVETAVLDGTVLAAGEVVQGPAILQRMGDSVVVPPGHVAELDAHLTIHLRGPAA